MARPPPDRIVDGPTVGAFNSGDGQTVVFDSPINAHSFDATVPPENDQPSNARLVVQLLPGQPAQSVTVEGAGSSTHAPAARSAG